MSERPTAREAMPALVLHRDEDLLVILKPAGIATTSPDGRRCLVDEARRLDPRAKLMHPTSRLDVGVTGVVLFARTDRAVAGVLRARAEKQYLRRYLALASGRLEGIGRWDWPIAIDPADKKHRVALEAGGKGERLQEASTRYESVEAHPRASRVWLFPETGRTHQLRVHAARAGHPLLGDVDYGGPKRIVLDDGRVITLKRPMLHCERVEIAHPATGAPLLFVAPPPEDLDAAWRSVT